ncbi:Actin-related protein 2/3 complex subunit 1A, partial [Cucurbita argyrosperma subsp. argyrosperma]
MLHFEICLFVMWILFVSERMVIGVGFDCNPMVFAADERGIWSFIRFLGERKPASASKYGSQVLHRFNFVCRRPDLNGSLTVQLFHPFSEAFGKLYGQPRQGVGKESVESSRLRGIVHENCINCIVPLRERRVSTIKRFSTSGLDGKVAIWDLEGQADLSQYL